jgi:hypothetical protein
MNGKSRTQAFDAAQYGLERQGAAADNEPLETSHFGFGLSSPQFVERACRLLRRPELSAKISTHLRHA